MGRLRDDYESPLFQCMTAEVVDLYGMDDVILRRYSAVDQLAVTDPLWGEPTTTARFKEFKIKAMYTEKIDDDQFTESGMRSEDTANVYVALAHLIGAGVNIDNHQDYIATGDTIQLHYKGQEVHFDILGVDRDGWINNTDVFTGYVLSVTRRTEYLPGRKSQDANDL